MKSPIGTFIVAFAWLATLMLCAVTVAVAAWVTTVVTIGGFMLACYAVTGVTLGQGLTCTLFFVVYGLSAIAFAVWFKIATDKPVKPGPV